MNQCNAFYPPSSSSASSSSSSTCSGGENGASAAGFPRPIGFAQFQPDQYRCQMGLEELMERNDQLLYFNSPVSSGLDDEEQEEEEDEEDGSPTGFDNDDDDDNNRHHHHLLQQHHHHQQQQQQQQHHHHHHLHLQHHLNPNQQPTSAGQEMLQQKRQAELMLMARQKRRHKTKKYKNPEVAQRQRHQANMRERRRMSSINMAFDGLRKKIPVQQYNKKLSKVDTLKLAISYIQNLRHMIETDDAVRADGKTDQSHSDTQRPTDGTHRLITTNTVTAPPIKKIVVECRSGAAVDLFNFPFQSSYHPMSYEEELIGVPPLQGHSLSWSRVGESSCNSLLSAKVWRPQPPSGPVAVPKIEHQLDL